MIGTVICRNCDTAIEVSDGDVSRFRASPVFACSVCQHDLSQRMAELIGRTADDASEEPTVADDEAYEGLPVGETLDQAAERMRGSRMPEPTPVMRNPDATPIMRNPDLPGAPGAPFASGSPEDPAALALRIAQQAQAQAQALVAQALAQVKPNDDASTGVMQVPSWRGGAAVAVAPAIAPDAAATAPGTPDLSPAVSARVGVVPEEPENQPTKKRREEAAEVGTVTDSTPLIAAQQRELESEEETLASDGDTLPGIPNPLAAMPEAPVAEMTPSVSSRGSPFVPDEPPREVTIRKTGAPAPLPKTPVHAPRTGTGPAGIGALGIRVTVLGRAVVRPAFNGRPAQLPSPAAETQVSGLNAIVDRPSQAGVAPWQQSAQAQRRRNPFRAIPAWVLFATGGGLAAIFGAVVVVQLVGGPEATPTPTPFVATTVPTPIETPTIEVHGTPKATATLATVTATPTAALFAIPSPKTTAPTPFAMPTHTPIPTPTPAIAKATTPPATPRPTARTGSNAQKIIDAATRKIAKGEDDQAMLDLYMAINKDAENEELLFQAFRLASKHGKRSHAKSWGEKYLALPGGTADRKKFVSDYLALLP